MVAPHGGKLIERLVPANKVDSAKKEAEAFPKLEISQETFTEMENIAVGIFSPMEGFLVKKEFDSVYDYAQGLGFENLFVQFPDEDHSRQSPFLPDFQQSNPFEP